MKFLVDNQLPAALAQYLRGRDLDSRHVLDVGLSNASDSQICRYATEHERIIVTKDEDFFYLASQPRSQVKLLWVRLGNCRTPKAFGRKSKLGLEQESESSSCGKLTKIPVP